MTQVDLSGLADSIATLILSRSTPPTEFWSYADIAYHMRASESKVRAWAALQDFPKPIRPPTGGPGLGHPIFKPLEIRRWANKYQESAHGRVGRPRNETG